MIYLATFIISLTLLTIWSTAYVSALRHEQMEVDSILSFKTKPDRFECAIFASFFTVTSPIWIILGAFHVFLQLVEPAIAKVGTTVLNVGEEIKKRLDKIGQKKKGECKRSGK